MKLCCIFNYAPSYRESIYTKIDQTFDTQWCFAKEVHYGKGSGIKAFNWSVLRKEVHEIKNRKVLGRFLWRTNIQTLPFKGYDKFLISGDLSLSYIPFLLCCKILGVPVYGWGHGSKTFNRGTGPIDKIFYKLLTGYFTYGEGGRNRLVELGVDEQKIRVIYNSLNEGVNPEEIEKLKSSVYFEYFKNSAPVLIFIGRLIPSKKLEWIIEAMKNHRRVGLNYNLMIIGTGSDEDKLRLLTKQYGLEERVWFYGACYDESKLNELLYNADLCVSPGEVGLTALHTMSYGTPVISHDNFEKQGPEYETIRNEETGLLFQYDNFDDFCLKVQTWLSLNHSRDIIRQNCYQVINTFWNSNYQLKLLIDTFKQ